MADTKLDGSGNYQTRQVGDYRVESFPNGSATTHKHTTLKLQKHRSK